MKSREKKDEKNQRITRKQTRTLALITKSAGELNDLQKSMIRYYYLAGEGMAEIADELTLDNDGRYRKGKIPELIIRQAIRGNRKGYFGHSYKALLSRSEREIVAKLSCEKSERTKQNKFENEVADIDELPDDQRLGADSEQDPESRVEQSLLTERLEQVLQTLSYREREVIQLRYGLFGSGRYTYDELRKMFGTSKGEIRRIELRALEKLAFPTRSVWLEEFIDNPPNWLIETNQKSARVYARSTYEGDRYQIVRSD